jgi:hypothetical protein
VHLGHGRGRQDPDLKLAGADDFLHKPFEIDVLIEKMCIQLDIETGVLA